MSNTKRLNKTPIHPGKILAMELTELNISASFLARSIFVPTNRITEILKGTRSITADTAIRLGKFFNSTPELWMNLQKNYELDRAYQNGIDDLDNIQHYPSKLNKGNK